MENYTQDYDSDPNQLSDDEQFECWHLQHSKLERQIEAIERRPYVTQADDLEEQRLKKIKLQIKDRMNRMLSLQRNAASA